MGFSSLKKHNYPQDKFFFKAKKTNTLVGRETMRFSYHLDLYCIEIFNYLLLLNIYFLVNLEYLKQDIEEKEEDEEEETEFFF